MSGRGAYYKAKYGGGGRGGRQYGDRGSASSHPYTKRAPQEETFRSPENYEDAAVSASGVARGDDLWNCLVSMEGELCNLSSSTGCMDSAVMYHTAYKAFIGAAACVYLLLCYTGKPYPAYKDIREFSRTPLLLQVVSACDFLNRMLKTAVLYALPDNIRIDKPGQYVLPRSSMVVTSEYVEARCTIGLPARGRRIEGRRAANLLCQHLRSQLGKRNLTSFVANGACLPRKTGVDDTPMTKQQEPHLVLFQSPPELECEFDLPNSGRIRGMGIPRGITLIVGGGFHGKSTMLEALQVGVYNKIPGDGREFVITEPNAVKIRAEDGRVVTSVDISPFINNLPFGRSTTSFSSADASGSTSQAANIMEALEFGATSLLIDEDTCATNFMIRDSRMQALVAREKEPITPFLFKFRVQTPLCEADVPWGPVPQRAVVGETLRAQGKVKVGGTRAISYGETTIDVSGVEQLAETSQTRAIACFIQKLADNCEDLKRRGKRSLRAMIEAQYEAVMTPSSSGSTARPLDLLSTWGHPVGDLALPRTLEIGFAISRLRGLRVSGTV
ncbi:hypothetical protein Emed_005150 [Eimeria media]